MALSVRLDLKERVKGVGDTRNGEIDSVVPYLCQLRTQTNAFTLDICPALTMPSPPPPATLIRLSCLFLQQQQSISEVWGEKTHPNRYQHEGPMTLLRRLCCKGQSLDGDTHRVLYLPWWYRPGMLATGNQAPSGHVSGLARHPNRTMSSYPHGSRASGHQSTQKTMFNSIVPRIKYPCQASSITSGVNT